MWWLYLIFAFILTLYCILVVIAYGVKLTVRLDTDNLSVCFKCYVFDWIEVFCIKLFECSGEFYYQVNKNRLKTIQKKEKEDDKKKNKRRDKKKLKIGEYVSKLWNKRPAVVIRRLYINYATDVEDVKNKAMLDGSVMVVSNALLASNSEKIKIKDFQLENIGEKTKFSGVEAECVVGLALLKIVTFAIRTMFLKKKYTVAR